MRTVSDSASMLLMTSCFDGWKVSCNEQRAAAEAPPWEGCVHPVTSRPHEAISSAWGIHGNSTCSVKAANKRRIVRTIFTYGVSLGTNTCHATDARALALWPLGSKPGGR